MNPDKALPVRNFTTRDGKSIAFTKLGFGSAPLGNYLRPLSEADCDATLQAAWRCGMRYFDTAPFYGFGLSETRVGRLLTTLPRTSFVVSTKVGRLFEPCEPDQVNSMFFKNTPQLRFYYDYSYDGVMRSYEESLKRLSLDRVDILYVHDVDAYAHDGRAGSEQAIRSLIDSGGWKALTELRSAGDISAIGAGVNEWQPCARLLELVDPDLFLLAGRYTLLEQEPLTNLFPQCAAKGAGVVIGGPYNSGVLAGKPTYNYADIPQSVAVRVRAIANVCAQFKVSLPAAALQFANAHPVVVSVIPGGQNVLETEANATLMAETIPAEFWHALKSLDLIDRDAPTPT